MDLGDLADSVQDLGLAQTIKDGLRPNLQKKPQWASPDEVAAKAEQVKAQDGWDVYSTALGQYCMSTWAETQKVRLDSTQVRRKSSLGMQSAKAPDETGPITADSIRTHWGNFTVSMEFQSMCKYMCLQDTTCKGKCTESLFYEMRPLGKGAFGAVFLVFKYDTGVGFATKKMMKKIVKKNGAVAHPALERAARAQRSPDGRSCQRGRQPCTSRRC